VSWQQTWAPDVPGLTYARVRTVDEALLTLAEDEFSHPLAGGTDLVMQRASGELDVTGVVDVKDVAELRGVAQHGDALRIGAATPMREVALLDAPHLGALADGAGLVGSVQTRARATLGGNVCRASPAGDTLPALLVLQAKLKLAAQSGERSLAAEEFFLGPGQTARRSDELLAAIELPLLAGGSAYYRSTQRQWMDLALVGVAARVVLCEGVCEEAALAIGGAAPTPVAVPDAAALLVGSSLDEPAVAAAGEAVAAAAQPISDVRGAAAHRRAVLVPLAKQAIVSAAGRLSRADRSAEPQPPYGR
jgi:CO/xanthine dehydrogenase FAD-binding subunit